MHEHRSKIDETLNFTQKQLDGLHSEITRSLEKIHSREKYLNGQLEPLLLEYRNLQVRNFFFFRCLAYVGGLRNENGILFFFPLPLCLPSLLVSL